MKRTLLFALGVCLMFWLGYAHAFEEGRKVGTGTLFNIDLGTNTFSDVGCADGKWTLGTGWTQASGEITKSYLVPGSTDVVHIADGNSNGGTFQLAYTVDMANTGYVTPTLGDVSGAPATASGGSIVFVTPTKGGRLKFTPSAGFSGSISAVYLTPTVLYSPTYDRYKLGEDLSISYACPYGGPVTLSYYVSNDGKNFVKAGTVYSSLGSVGYITNTSGAGSDGYGVEAITPTVSKEIKVKAEMLSTVEVKDFLSVIVGY